MEDVADQIRDAWTLSHFTQHPIRTSRLSLRPLAESDAADVWHYQSDREILRYLPWPERTEAESHTHTQQRSRTNSTLVRTGDTLAIAIVHLDQVIGDLTLRVLKAEELRFEIGWVIASAHQGQGYAREAAEAALEFAFDTVGAHRVLAFLDARNDRSAILCERLGLQREGTQFEFEWDAGTWVDLAGYGIDVESWRAQRSERTPPPREIEPHEALPPKLLTPSKPGPVPLQLPFDAADLATRPLLTDRLVVRPYQGSDAPAFHAMLADPEVTRHLTSGHIDEEEARRLVDERARQTVLAHDGDAIRLAATRDGVFAGNLKLQIESVHARSLEIGWALAREFQGQGLATEAAEAPLRLAFTTLQAHRVFAYSEPANGASVAMATRLGMRPEQWRFSDWQRPDGTWGDGVLFAITATEWRARQNNTQAPLPADS